MTLPVRARPVVLVLGLAVALAACGDDGTAGPESTATTTAVPSVGDPTTTTPSAPTTAAGHLIEVQFRDGTVTGETRQQVRRGQTVRLVVTSDVADEVHVHGYDRLVAVPAGGTAEISFTADIPGVFEVELEQRHRRLLTLEVRG